MKYRHRISGIVLDAGSGGFDAVRSLFCSFDHSLAVRAVLAGAAPGKVFVDDLEDPAIAVLMVRSRIYLAVRQGAHGVVDELYDIRDHALPAYRHEAGIGMLSIHYTEPELDDPIAEVFGINVTFKGMRRYYEREVAVDSLQTVSPEDFVLRPVDARLLSEERLANLDDLRYEMCSERPSVQDFLDRSFGVCLVKDNELVGWCLSEYNLGDRCEVGIEVVDGHRRKRLGVLLVSAFMRSASAHGVRRVGWHCWAFNDASNATAASAGFTHSLDYQSCILRFE